jgi:DNA repair/transcription protein MET18/MMS19
VLNRAVNNQTISLDAYYDRVVVGLSRKATAVQSGPLANENVLDLLGRLVNLIVRNSSPEHIQHAADNVYLLFRKEESPDEQVGMRILLDPPTTTILSTWLLAAIPRKTTSRTLVKEQILKTVDDLISYATKSTNPAITQSCLLQVGLYANKHVENSDLGSIDSLLADRLEALKEQSMDEAETPDFDIRLCFSLTKALTLRLAPKTNQYLHNLVNALDQNYYPSEVSRRAAMGFATLLAPDDILS